MEIEPTDKEQFDAELKRNKKLPKVIELLEKGLACVSVAKEINVHPATVRRWLRKATVPSLTYTPRIDADKRATEAAEKRMHDGEDPDDILSDYTDKSISELKTNSSEKEDEVMAEIAAAQSTPSDKYQHYIAAAGIKLLRDSMKNLRGPRSVKELSELDQLIRRNLGLNAKNAGGQSKMQIDISILNNGIADKGRGSLKRMKKDAIDVDEVTDS